MVLVCVSGTLALVPSVLEQLFHGLIQPLRVEVSKEKLYMMSTGICLYNFVVCTCTCTFLNISLLTDDDWAPCGRAFCFCNFSILASY